MTYLEVLDFYKIWYTQLSIIMITSCNLTVELVKFKVGEDILSGVSV
jgi:hypothetical protein